MRGRYTAAIWLFAALLLGLLAVGAAAPRPRESARLRVARANLAARSAQTRPLAENSSIRPESGCLRHRSMVTRKNEPGDALAALVVTPSAETRDPSARDFAYHQLVKELRREWAEQPSNLEPTVIVYVSTEASPPSAWARCRSLILPDLSAALDRLRRAATEIVEAAYDHWESWTHIDVCPESPELTPFQEQVRAAQIDAFDGDWEGRVERSILVRAESSGRNRVFELAERDEQSILIR